MAIIQEANANAPLDQAISGHVRAFDPATGSSRQRAHHRKYSKRHNDQDFDKVRYLTAKSCEYFKRAFSNKTFGNYTSAEYTARLSAQFLSLFQRGTAAGMNAYETTEVIRQAFLSALDTWSNNKPDLCPAVPANAIAALVTSAHWEHFANLIHADRLSTVRTSELFGYFLLPDQFEYASSKDWKLKSTLSGSFSWLSKPPNQQPDPNSNCRLEIDRALALAHIPYLLRDIGEYIGDNVPQVKDPALGDNDTYLGRIKSFLEDDHFPGADKKLRNEDKKMVLVSLRDKLRLEDINLHYFGPIDVQFKSLEIYWTCYELLAEEISEARRDDLLNGLGDDKVLLLIERCFSGEGPYYNVREGSYHILVAIRRKYAANTEIRKITEGLLTTWLSYDHLTSITRTNFYGPANPLPTAAQARQQLEQHADNNVAAFISWVKGEMIDWLNANKGKVLIDDPDSAEGTAHKKETYKVYKRIAGDIDELIQWTKNTATQAHFIAFLKIFGFRPKHTFKSSENGMNGGLFVRFECAWQILLNLRALAENNKTVYKEGLRRIAFALPTAFKPLNQYHYVSSQLETIQSLLTTIGEGDLADYPFMIFDQSTQTIFNKNAAYLGELAARMNANIHHIGIRDVVDLAIKLGIPEFFVTTEVDTEDNWSNAEELTQKYETGRLNCGYGGARNIVALLGSMFHLAYRGGDVQAFSELKDLNKPALARLLRRALFDKPFLIMGDDDLTLMPGFMHSKAAIAHCISRAPAQRNVAVAVQGQQLVRDEIPYVKVMTLIQGRGTTTVPGGALDTSKITGYSNKSEFLRFLTAGVAPSISWKDVRIHKAPPGAYPFSTALMAGNLLHPASCADLPHPTEEKVMNGMVSILDQLGHTLHHPTDRYDSFPKRNAGLCFYVQKIQIAQSITAYAKRGYDLPWNTPSASLGATYTKIITNETSTAYKTEVLNNAIAWTGHDKLPQWDAVRGHFQQLRSSMAAAFRADPLLLKEVDELEKGYQLLCAERDAAVFFKQSALQGVNNVNATDAIQQSISDAVDAWNARYDSDNAEVRMNFRKSNLTYMVYLSLISVLGGRFYRLLNKIINLCNEHAADPQAVPAVPAHNNDLDDNLQLPVDALLADNPPIEELNNAAPDADDEDEQLEQSPCQLCGNSEAPVIYECHVCQSKFSVCESCQTDYDHRAGLAAGEGDVEDLCTTHLHG